MTNAIPTLSLRSGGAMPQIALGTWPMVGDEVERATASALEIGYRHVDTAEAYENEDGIGRALAASGIDRSELFVTTKFQRKWHGDVASGVQGNLERLGLDYVDLVLIHWPNPDQDLYVTAWEGLIELQKQGLARAIGTSNFKATHIDRLIAETGVVPEVNQIEMHPYYDRAPERAYHAEKGIVTEAWSPLARGRIFDDPVVRELADRVGRTPSQVVLRWHLQRGDVVMPKSVHHERMAENLAVTDFALDAVVMRTIDRLNVGERSGSHPDRVELGEARPGAQTRV